MQKDPYTVLGVKRESSLATIKAAFHSLAHKTHPDKVGGSGDAFKEVSEAWAQIQRFHQSSEYAHGQDPVVVWNTFTVNADLFNQHFVNVNNEINWDEINRILRQYGKTTH